MNENSPFIHLVNTEFKTTKPESVKKISTPRKPPGKSSSFKWKSTTDITDAPLIDCKDGYHLFKVIGFCKIKDLTF